MSGLFKVEGVVLTKEQNRIIKTWRKAWPCATDEERQRMQDEFAKMIRGTKQEEVWQSQGNGIKTSAPEEAAAVAAAILAAEEKEGEIDPLKGRPHAQYCGGAELMVIVEMDSGKWADYATFLTKNPEKTIFDIDHRKVAVAYMNQRAYDAVMAAGNALEPEEVNKCLQRLPEELAPFELSFLEALLCMEADYDQRIKKLGYKGENMKDYRDCGLLKDYFTGKIYEALHGKKDQMQNSGKGKEGKGTGNGNGNGQSRQVKPSGKTGNKTGGSKGTIRSGTHDQATAALFL